MSNPYLTRSLSDMSKKHGVDYSQLGTSSRFEINHGGRMATDGNGNGNEIDWELVEAEYRTGQFSNVALGKRHGCSETAIRKRAKGNGGSGRKPWVKDLMGAVRQTARRRLLEPEAFNHPAYTRGKEPGQEGDSEELTDEEIIEHAADRQVEVIKSHRTDIVNCRTLYHAMITELSINTENIDEIEDSIIEETKHDKDKKRSFNMLRAVSLPTRVDSLNRLSSVLKNLIDLERRAYSLDAEAGDDDSPDSITLPGPMNGFTPAAKA